MSTIPQLIILKTTTQHLKGVVENQKHALQGRMVKARPGDLLLICEIQAKGPALMRYAMRFKAQYIDTADHSESIWGKPWKFIVSGEDGCWLDQPFAPAKIKPDGPYGQGGTVVYVPPGDAEEFIREGRLAPAV